MKAKKISWCKSEHFWLLPRVRHFCQLCRFFLRSVQLFFYRGHHPQPTFFMFKLQSLSKTAQQGPWTVLLCCQVYFLFWKFELKLITVEVNNGTSLKRDFWRTLTSKNICFSFSTFSCSNFIYLFHYLTISSHLASRIFLIFLFSASVRFK